MKEGDGVDNADFVLYVSAHETKSCGGNTVAHAMHCMKDPITDRHICTYFQIVVFLINFSLFPVYDCSAFMKPLVLIHGL